MSGIYPNVPSVLFSVVLTALIVISLQKPLLSQTPKDTFVDGKTIVTEIAFEGLDSDFEVSLPNLAVPLRESTGDIQNQRRT